RLDFVADCRQRYAGGKEPAARRDTFERMRRSALGQTDESDLALAAWLHRLGQDKLAAQALARARTAENPVARLREELAWGAFAGLVHAYVVRADAEALAHGERLLRLYPAEAAGKRYKQARAVVAELKRRRQKGTFGKAPPALPKDLPRWDVKKRV